MGKKRKETLLFIPLGVGIAHTGRLLTVARKLRKRGYNVIFAAGKEVEPIIKSEGFKHHMIPELPRSKIQNAQNLKPSFFPIKTIEYFVEKELKAFGKYKPSCVISDMRITARLSSKIAQVPMVSIVNANVTKYYDYSECGFPFPYFFIGKFIPEKLLVQFEKDWIQRRVLEKVGPKLIETMLLKEHMKFNIVLGMYGIRPFKSPFDLVVGDLNLISDAPFFRKVKKTDDQTKMIGPLFWQPDIPIPKVARKLVSRGKKIIYVTAGGTGDGEIFKNIIKYLSDYPAIIVGTTGNTLDPKSVKEKGDNTYIFDYLPGDWITSKASAIICFGGNLTIYQSLASGVPQVSIPLHVDQQDNTNQTIRIGTGTSLNPYKITKEVLFKKLNKVISDPKIRRSSKKYKKELALYDGPSNAADEIEKFLKTIPKAKREPKTKLDTRIKNIEQVKELKRLNDKIKRQLQSKIESQGLIEF